MSLIIRFFVIIYRVKWAYVSNLKKALALSCQAFKLVARTRFIESSNGGHDNIESQQYWHIARTFF